MNRGEKIHALAALKGLFIWIIVLHNTFLIDALLEHIPGMAFIRIFGGDLGNSMFFMLSGFLISWGYRERIRNDCISFGDYLRRRIKKLYPMYAISNAAALLVAVWQYGVSAINLKKSHLPSCCCREAGWTTVVRITVLPGLCQLCFFAIFCIMPEQDGLKAIQGTVYFWLLELQQVIISVLQKAACLSAFQEMAWAI